MNIEQFIDEWLLASNSYDTQKYLEFYHEDAVLDDPSVGRKYNGLNDIKDYFDSYFTGYQTQTTKTSLMVIDDTHAHLEVEFTGNFPEGKIGGIFDFVLKDDKIVFAKADLM